MNTSASSKASGTSRMREMKYVLLSFVLILVSVVAILWNDPYSVSLIPSSVKRFYDIMLLSKQSEDSINTSEVFLRSSSNVGSNQEADKQNPSPAKSLDVDEEAHEYSNQDDNSIGHER